MDCSLDDYINQKGLNITKTGIRDRLGFQRGPIQNTGISAPRKWSGQFGVNSTARPYDARQKLTSRPVQVLGSGRIVGSRVDVEKNGMPSDIQPVTFQNASNHSIMLKTKFADARQRLEMKRRQPVNRGDARMKLLAARRFGAQGSSMAVGQQQQTAAQIAVVPEGQKTTVLTHPPMTGNSYSLSEAMSAPSRVFRTGPSPVVHVSAKPVPIKPTTSFGLKFTQPAPTTMSLSGSSLRRTFNTQSRQQSTASLVEVDFGADDGASKTPYKISFCNDKYEEPRPIETIVTSRTAKPQLTTGRTKRAAAAANAAAKIAVTAAALAAKRGARPVGMTASKTVAAQKQPVLKRAVPAVVSTPAAIPNPIRSPIQGYKISVSNLHSDVSLDDLLELFSDVGALKNTRLLRPGVADVVFVNVEDAVAAVRMYNTRELDGRPMVVKQLFQSPPETSLERSQPSIELDIPLLHRALFKTVVEGSRPSAPVSFTVQL